MFDNGRKVRAAVDEKELRERITTLFQKDEGLGRVI
jgi:hypothetical protein